MCSVLISCCVCRRPSWKPKTQPNGSSVGWVFGFQLDLLEKTWPLFWDLPLLGSAESATTRNSTNGAVRRRLVKFLEFSSNYLKKVIWLARENMFEESTRTHYTPIISDYGFLCEARVGVRGFRVKYRGNINKGPSTYYVILITV